MKKNKRERTEDMDGMGYGRGGKERELGRATLDRKERKV